MGGGGGVWCFRYTTSDERQTLQDVCSFSTAVKLVLCKLCSEKPVTKAFLPGRGYLGSTQKDGQTTQSIMKLKCSFAVDQRADGIHFSPNLLTTTITGTMVIINKGLCVTTVSAEWWAERFDGFIPLTSHKDSTITRRTLVETAPQNGSQSQGFEPVSCES